jgi:hypothetical protein
MTTVTEAWRSGRATQARTRRTRPEPLVAVLVGLFARLWPSWVRLRSTVLQVGGLAAIEYGLFGWSHLAGWIGLGVTLFLLEWLGGGERK